MLWTKSTVTLYLCVSIPFRFSDRMNDSISSSQTNVMITDNGRPCLSDVGLNAGLAKVILDSDKWPVPSGWMFKAPEELSFECEPASFIHTKAMDVYSLGITTYTVSLVCSMFV